MKTILTLFSLLFAFFFIFISCNRTEKRLIKELEEIYSHKVELDLSKMVKVSKTNAKQLTCEKNIDILFILIVFSVHHVLLTSCF